MTELLPGTLDLLILRVLNSGPLHGFGIGERIHVLSERALSVEEGSLYSLTKTGRKQLEAARQNWTKSAVAIGQILMNA